MCIRDSLSIGTRQINAGFSSLSFQGQWGAGWVVITIIVLLFEFSVVAAVGRLVKGYSYYYFFNHPTVFDAEDITAMSLSAHYALIRSLDNAGIDTSKLRIKEKFTGGRRGEDI